MRTIGFIATIVATGGVLALAATVVASLPDIARYRRLKRM